MTAAAWGVPNVLASGTKSNVTRKWAGCVHNTCLQGGPSTLERGTKSEYAHKWLGSLHNPCHLGGAQRFTLCDIIRSDPQVDRVATYPLPPGGSSRIESGGQNQKWPTSGLRGYTTPEMWGIHDASEFWKTSEMARKCAAWLHNPCHLGGRNASNKGPNSKVTHSWGGWLHKSNHIGRPHSFTAGDKIRSYPQMYRVPT